MAGKKQNLKALFTNTRSRVIIIFTTILLVTAVIIGFMKFFYASGSGKTSSLASLSTVPKDIQSIPGSIDPTAQYANLQEVQNVSQAQQALSTGSSAIPTIIRSQQLSEGVNTLDAQNGRGSVGFDTLSRQEDAGSQQGLWVQELQSNNCSKSTLNKVIEQGATLVDLKKACTCIQLKDNGYEVGTLTKICSCQELKASGFSASQLKSIGYNTIRLRLCGFDACAIRNASFSAQQMKDGGYSDGELKGAGFSEQEIVGANGLPSGMTDLQVRKAGCNISSIENLRKAGVTAGAIRRINGCNVKQLYASGFDVKQLMNAGFTAADLKKANVSLLKLKQAGFSARELLNAGFTPKALIAVGFSTEQINAAEAELLPGMSIDDIKKAGCSVPMLANERIAGVSAKLIKQYANCGISKLRQAQFDVDDLKNAGFSAAEIAADSQMSNKTVTDEMIKAANCDDKQLSYFFEQGVTAKQIKQQSNCDVSALKTAGYDALALLTAGFTPSDLTAAGFSADDLEKAQFNLSAIIAQGRIKDCNNDSLIAAHKLQLSPLSIRNVLGCSAKNLATAGYDALDLKKSGFTAAELKAAGFNAFQLKTAGFSAKELSAAGFNAQDLKMANVTAQEMRDAGFNAKTLKIAGFSAKQLKDAGFSVKDLYAAGFSAQTLKNQNFSAAQLKEAGFALSELKQAGFDSQMLKNAGFTNINAENTSADTSNTTLPQVPGTNGGLSQNRLAAERANTKQLHEILVRQTQQLADQRYQQKIQQRGAEMASAANQDLQLWKRTSTQIYAAGAPKISHHNTIDKNVQRETNMQMVSNSATMINTGQRAFVKTGDILLAVIDTAVNSDEPGPILATIVSGKLKGAKLIGSFTLPANAEKMVISFNTLSVPGANRSISISAVAIDPNTARTALSSNTDHHYLLRYGSLFASSFIEGIGNAYQSANTSVTVSSAGTGAITIQNGIKRSTLDNAVIGLSTVGKNWGQAAQQQFSTPITVEVYSGMAIGVLFTQNVMSLS